MITFNHQQFVDEIAQRIDAQAVMLGRTVVQIAQRYAPKHTGYMATSISFAYDKQSHAISFIVGAPYGVFQEYGTRNMPAHPYLRPALNTVGTIYGFDTSMEFQNVIRTDTKLLSHGPTYQMHKSLTEKQKAHVRTNLKPVAERHHIGNVSRAKLKVRHGF